MKNYLDFGFRIVGFGLLIFAVLPLLVKIATNSSASFNKVLSLSYFIIPDSCINSSQNKVSSASSSTTVILEIKSAFDLARHADL